MLNNLKSLVLAAVAVACATAPGVRGWEARRIEGAVPTFVSGLAISTDEVGYVAVLGNESRGYRAELRDLEGVSESVRVSLPLVLSADDAVLGAKWLLVAGQADAHSQASSLVAVRAPRAAGAKAEIRRQLLSTLGRTGPVDAYGARIGLSPSEGHAAAVAAPADKVATPPHEERGSVTVLALPNLSGVRLIAPNTHRCTAVSFLRDDLLLAACRTVAGAWVLHRWQLAQGTWQRERPLPVFQPQRDPAWWLAAFSMAASDHVALGWSRGATGAVTWRPDGQAYAPLPMAPADLHGDEEAIRVLGVDGSLYRVTRRDGGDFQVRLIAPAPTRIEPDVPPPRGVLSASGRVALVAAHGLEAGPGAALWLRGATP